MNFYFFLLCKEFLHFQQCTSFPIICYW